MATLPVLNSPSKEAQPTSASIAPQLSDEERQRLAAQLTALDVGQVRFSHHDQMLYSTDASIYQIEPIGVVVPRDVEALAKVVRWAGEKRVALLPRGGGTSLPGQCTNRAVVVDHSACCRRVLNVDAASRICHVEPGITIDELNRDLESRKTGLFFAPDPATAAQATIGGVIADAAADGRLGGRGGVGREEQTGLARL